MTIGDFRASLERTAPPPDLPPLLAALWWEAKGNWTRAHEIAQDVASHDGAWLHAYLHRREGDEGNAGYWYGQAGKPHCRLPHEEEREQIVLALLGQPGESTRTDG
jgi:hypothetical protein